MLSLCLPYLPNSHQSHRPKEMDLDQTTVCDVHKYPRLRKPISIQLSLYPLILPSLPRYSTIVSEGQITDFFSYNFLEITKKSHTKIKKSRKKPHTNSGVNARWLGLEQLFWARELWGPPRGPLRFSVMY